MKELRDVISFFISENGIVSGAKNGNTFPVSDLFQYKILFSNGKRSWYPKFYVEEHPELLQGEDLSVKDLDAKLPLMIGCAEFLVHMLSCTDNVAEIENELFHMEEVYVKRSAGTLSYDIINESKDLFQDDCITSNEILDYFIKKFYEKGFPNLDQDEEIKKNRGQALFYRRTKNCNNVGTSSFLNSFVNKLYVIYCLDQDDFEYSLANFVKYAINMIHSITNELKIENSKKSQKEKGKFLTDSLDKFMTANQLDSSDPITKIALLSGVSIDDWASSVMVKTTAFYETKGAISLKNKKNTIYDMAKNDFVSSFLISDCTTACSMLFVRLMACICNSFKIRNQTQVNWFDEELDAIISKCLGTDDFGRFIKSGKINTGDLSLYSYKNIDRPFLTKMEIINIGISKFYEDHPLTTETPMEYFYNFREHEYIDFYVVSEILNELAYCSEIARIRAVFEEKKDTVNKEEEYVNELEQEVSDLNNTLADIMEKDANIKKYEETISSLNKKIADLEHVIEVKQSQIDNLKKGSDNLEKGSEPDAPLIPISENQSEVSLSDMIDYLKEKQIFFVGGRWDMLDRLEEKGLSKDHLWQMIRESQKFDRPQNPDMICYMTKFANHSMYFTVKNNYETEISTSYNSTNLDNLIRHLYQFGRQLENNKVNIQD